MITCGWKQGCNGPALKRAVLIVSESYSLNPKHKLKLRMSVNFCASCADFVRVGQLLTENVWKMALDGFKEKGWGIPDRRMTELQFEDVGASEFHLDKYRHPEGQKVN